MATRTKKPTKETARLPTLSDVALQAGVSYATADRVINKRGNVAEKSVLKVQLAVEALGYVRNVAAANLSRGRSCRLAFILPKGTNAFFTRANRHLSILASHLSSDQVNIDIIEIAAFETEALKQSILSILNKAYDGIAVVGLQSTELVEPLKQIRDQGTVVVGLVSDLPVNLRQAYVGIDNVAAGRTAARLVGMSHASRKGRVQMIAGSRDARDHDDRLKGFQDVIAEDYSNIELLNPIMTRDRADQVSKVVCKALKAKPTVTAVYNAGAGNTGLVDALEHSSVAKQPFCIVHELVPHTRKALLDKHLDIVIDQRPDEEIDRAVTILKALIDNRAVPPMQELVPTIYVRDNLPSAISDSYANENVNTNLDLEYRGNE